MFLLESTEIHSISNPYQSRDIYFAKYYGGGEGEEWLLGKKIKTEGVEKKMKKKGKGKGKNGLKTHL